MERNWYPLLQVGYLTGWRSGVSELIDAVRKHVGNQLSLEKQILEAVERQRQVDKLRESLEANKMVIEVERVLKAHIIALEQLTSEYGEDAATAVKKAVSEVFGFITGVYEKMRSQVVSRIIRDDYAALSLSAMGYTALHTFGLVANEKRIADLALQHLEDITPLIVNMSKVLPVIVAKEVGEEIGLAIDNDVAETAVRNTHSKWNREIVES